MAKLAWLGPQDQTKMLDLRHPHDSNVHRSSARRDPTIGAIRRFSAANHPVATRAGRPAPCTGSGVPVSARLFSVYLILLTILPFTAPVATFDLSDFGNATEFGAGLMVKADKAPDESLAIAAPPTPSSLLSTVVVLDSFQSADWPSHTRRIFIVLRL
jgi:hypothetical protein